MSEEELKALVFESLDAAFDNGCDQLVLHDDPADVAGDMIAYDDDIASAVDWIDEPVPVLVPLIEKWREQHV